MKLGKALGESAVLLDDVAAIEDGDVTADVARRELLTAFIKAYQKAYLEKNQTPPILIQGNGKINNRTIVELEGLLISLTDSKVEIQTRINHPTGEILQQLSI